MGATIVLGVSRSGTTLLRVMLDRDSELAIPDESFFVLPLTHRHRDPVRARAFLDDLRRLPRLRELGLRPSVSKLPQHLRLAQPPTPGVRDRRDEMSREDALAFEEVAGDTLRDSGYEVVGPARRRPAPRGRLEIARFAARSRSWNAAVAVFQRSPLWRRAHPEILSRCRGRDSNPHARRHPILSRARLTSFATPARGA